MGNRRKELLFGILHPGKFETFVSLPIHMVPRELLLVDEDFWRIWLRRWAYL